MSKEINIVIADDHLICVQGLHDILEDIPGFKVTGQAYNGFELVEKCKTLKPDVVITDVKMPGMDGLTAISEIKKLSQPPVILAMSAKDEEMDVYDAFCNGAKGFLTKAAQRNEIKEAVEAVLYGYWYYCNIKSKWLTKLIREYPYPLLPKNQNAFTARELEVMQLLQAQKTSSEIGEELFISPKTVNGHRNQLLKKTNAKNVVGIVLHALRNRLIKPDK